jgi:YHS domain-containing protein
MQPAGGATRRISAHGWSIASRLRIRSAMIEPAEALPESLMEETRMKHQDTHQTYKDPVCGMELSSNTATDTFEHKGKMYYFCAPTCRKTFEESPELFVRPHRQHGM